MSGRKRVAVLAGFATTCAVAVMLAVTITGGSARTVRDGAATNVYLAARRVVEAKIERLWAKRSSAVSTYVSGIVDTCGGALRHAPPITGNGSYELQGSKLRLSPRAILFFDATGGVEQAMRLPADAAAVLSFTREVRGLRWTDAGVTELVRTFGETEEAQLKQEAPELCRGVREWVASGYKSLAPQTSRAAERAAGLEATLTRALAKEHCVSPYPGRAVLHVLEQIMSSGQRMTAREISRLEARVAGKEAAILDSAVAQIERALGGRLRAHGGDVRPLSVVPPCIAVPRTPAAPPAALPSPGYQGVSYEWTVPWRRRRQFGLAVGRMKPARLPRGRCHRVRETESAG
jgi:hypothetical protein